MSRSRRAVTSIGRLAIAAAVAGLALGVSACEAGTNAPTLQFHPQGAGLDTMVHGIQISNAFVLGAPGGALPTGQSAGIYLALYNQGGFDKLVSASAPGTAKSVPVPNGGIGLPTQRTVYLTGPKPVIVLTGLLHPLQSGGTTHVVFTFMNAGSITLTLPVIPRTDYYATFSPPASPSPSPAKSGHGGTGAPTGTPSSAPATGSATPAASGSPTP